MLAHLGQRAADFDARRPAAHHYDVEQRLSLGRVVGEQGLLKILEDEAPQIQGIGDALDLHGILFQGFVAKEVGERTGGQH